MVDALSCLSQNLLHARNHRLEIAAITFYGRLVTSAPGALDAVGNLTREALGLTDDTACDGHQSAVALPHALLALLASAARGPADLHETATRAARTIAHWS